MKCRRAPRSWGALRSKTFSGAGASLAGNDVDHAATATGAELDRAGLQGEQGVVATAAHAGARGEVGAPLADDDLAGAVEFGTRRGRKVVNITPVD